MVEWTPDTCGCVFIVNDDWLSAKPKKVCEHHADAKDPFISVQNENAFKNVAVSYAMDATPDVQISATYTLGSLTLYVSGGDSDAKNKLQSNLDQHFGPGEIVVS